MALWPVYTAAGQADEKLQAAPDDQEDIHVFHERGEGYADAVILQDVMHFKPTTAVPTDRPTDTTQSHHTSWNAWA